jgi:hypothetical protein
MSSDRAEVDNDLDEKNQDRNSREVQLTPCSSLVVQNEAEAALSG